MLPGSLLNTTVTIKRRISTGRDSLNNPTYGTPTSGSGWDTVYQNVPARLALSSNPVSFAREGERVTPNGVVYFNPGVELKEEDRIVTSEGVEYNIISVATGFNFGGVVSHYECMIQLP